MRTARRECLGAIAFAAIAGRCGGRRRRARWGCRPHPRQPSTSGCSTQRLPRAHRAINTVQFAGTIEQPRRTAPTPANTIFGAAGDLVGASLFASADQNDDPTIDVLNALEAADLVASATTSSTRAFRRPRQPHRAACALELPLRQLLHAGTTTPAFPEFQVFTVGTVTVGYIGAVTQETPTLVSPTGVANLSFGDPVAAVNRVAEPAQRRQPRQR